MPSKVPTWEDTIDDEPKWEDTTDDSQDRTTLQNFLTATTPTQIRQPRALGPDRAVTGVAGDNITPFDPNQLPGLQDPFIDIGQGVVDLGEAAVGLTSMPTFGATGKLLEKATGFDPDFAREWMGEFYSPSRKEAQREVGRAKGFLGTSKALLENPSIIGETITRSLPAVAGGGALGRGVARIAPKLGSIGAAAVGEGAVASGMAAENFRGENESGFLNPKQAALAATTGLTTALVGILGGRIGKHLGVDDVDTLLTKGRGTPAQQSVAIGKLLKGAAVEGFIEELPQTVLEQIQANIATGKPWNEGVPEGAAQGLFAGLGMGAGANVVSPMMSGRSQSVLDEQDIIPPQPDAAAVEQAAIEGGRGQRRVGVQIPDTGNVLSDPQAAQLADQALREAQSPIQVPGRTPAIDLLRNELLPPTLAQVPAGATRTAEGGVLPSRERRGPVVVAGEEAQRDLARRQGLTEKEIDETSLSVAEPPSPKAKTFVEAMASDKSITNRSDNPDMVTTQDTGMNLGSVADLDAVLESYRQLATETEGAREKMRSGTLQPQEMMQLAARMQKRQLPREVVETAANIGAWADDKPIVKGKLGERPLDWRKNPEVAAWLVKNGPELGIDVSEVQAAGTSLSQSTPSTEITIPSKSEVQSVVDQLQKDYPSAAPVVVVENYHELPDSTHQAAYRQGGNPVGINGAVSGGKVYIVSNNLESAEEARQIWLHEQAGHFATDKILGPKLQKFMEQVADSFADSELMTDTKSRYKEASKSRLGREFVARLAENPQAAPNLWNRIVAQFRAWLRDIGWVKEVSENDIAALLNRSLESLAKKAEGLANEDVNLSLKTAAQAAASRYPAPATPAATPPAGTPPTPPAALTAAPATPPGGTPTTLDDVYKIFEPSPKTKTPLREKGARFIESIRTGFSSKFRPLNELAEDIAKTYGLSRRKDVAGIMEQLKGSQGKAEAEIYRFDRDVSSLVKGDEKDFNAYIFLRRSLDRLNQDLLDIQRAQAGQTVPKLNRRSVGNYTIPQLEAKLNALEQKLGADKLAKFEEAANGYQAYLDQALRLQVESGRMSPQIYQAIKDGNEFYAPFKVMKYLEETALPQGSGRRIDTVADFTKAMEGIESPDFKLGDMLAAARQSILMSRILADKNMAMRHFAQLANYDFNEIFFKPLKAGQEAQKGMEPISVLENGEVKRFAVRPEVAEAVQIYGGTAADLFTRALATASIPFRAGATALNLPFQISNLLADTPRAALVSKYGVRGATDLVRYPLDFVQSLYSSIAGDVFGYDNKLFQDFLDSGVAGTTVQEYLTPEALKFREPTSISKSKKLANTVLFTIPRFAQAIEQTSKVLGVKRAMRFEGATSGKELAQRIPDAITELRRFSGSPDFGRQGKWVDQYRLNLIYMFLNARIQGTIADVGRLAGRDGSKMAARTWFGMATAVGIPTVLLYMLNSRDEYKEDYEKRPEQEKDNYWLIPKDSFITNDDGERMRDYWRIPKREISKWTANLTESALNFAERKDPQALKEFAGKMVEELTPVNISGDSLTERAESVLASLNPLIKAPLEFGTGRDFYRHRDIVPDRMQKASPEQQYLPRTSEAFKVLAEKMPDIAPEALRSPLILENLTKNATAGLLTQFLPRKPIEGRSKLENTPLLARFQAVPYTDSKALQEQLDDLEREAADEVLTRFRAAEKLIADNKDKPLAEILQKAPKDEKLMQKVADLWLADMNGVTASERRILSLPVRQRAAYVADQLSQLEGAERQAKMIELSRKRILTEGVFQELPNVMP